jgi:uncharacterized protein YegL
MVRSAPPADWVVYLVVLGVAAATLFGKHLIMKGDEPIEQAIKEDIEAVEKEIEHLEEEVEKKLK